MTRPTSWAAITRSTRTVPRLVSTSTSATCVAVTCTRYGLGLPLSTSCIGTGWKVPLKRIGCPAACRARATSASDTVGPAAPVSGRGTTRPSLSSRLSYERSNSSDAVASTASLQLDSGLFHRIAVGIDDPAARRGAGIGRARGVAAHHRHRVERQRQLARGDERQRSVGALAHVHRADKRRTRPSLSSSAIDCGSSV